MNEENQFSNEAGAPQFSNEASAAQFSNEADVFWGRCDPEVVASSPFKFGAPHWNDDGTCSHCGGMRPSVALKAIKEGAEVEPTDKNYKMYIRSLSTSACPTGKCYMNHFSESQAIELVLLWMKKQINFATPGTFYSGLPFGRYETAIDKAVQQWKAENAVTENSTSKI